MNNIAVSLNVVQGSPASKSHSEQVEKSDCRVSPQPTQSKFGGGKGPGFYILTLMPSDSDAQQSLRATDLPSLSLSRSL